MILSERDKILLANMKIGLSGVKKKINFIGKNLPGLVYQEAERQVKKRTLIMKLNNLEIVKDGEEIGKVPGIKYKYVIDDLEYDAAGNFKIWAKWVPQLKF